jgi:hypothetical protein
MVWSQPFFYIPKPTVQTGRRARFLVGNTPPDRMPVTLFRQIYTIHQQGSKPSFFNWFFQSLQLNYFTMYVDSTVMARYGEQNQGVKTEF